MEYNNITKFLEKFKIILFKKEEIYKIISETILKYTNINIEIKLIKIKNTIIQIEGSPILKNEILINKENILLDLKKNIINYNFSDIK